jgi:hypothetical protein
MYELQLHSAVYEPARVLPIAAPTTTPAIQVFVQQQPYALKGTGEHKTDAGSSPRPIHPSIPFPHRDHHPLMHIPDPDRLQRQYPFLVSQGTRG